MTLKTVFVSCLTALLGVTGCANSPSDQKSERDRIIKMLPDHTVIDPKTGCRYIKDDRNPDAPQPCIPNDFPQRQMK